MEKTLEDFISCICDVGTIKKETKIVNYKAVITWNIIFNNFELKDVSLTDEFDIKRLLEQMRLCRESISAKLDAFKKTIETQDNCPTEAKNLLFKAKEKLTSLVNTDIRIDYNTGWTAEQYEAICDYLYDKDLLGGIDFDPWDDREDILDIVNNLADHEKGDIQDILDYLREKHFCQEQLTDIRKYKLATIEEAIEFLGAEKKLDQDIDTVSPPVGIKKGKDHLRTNLRDSKIKRLFSLLIQQGAIGEDTTEDEFIYYMTGNGNTPTRKMQWLKNNIELGELVYYTCGSNVPWSNLRNIFVNINYESVRSATMRKRNQDSDAFRLRQEEIGDSIRLSY